MKRLLLILIGWASISLASSPLWANPLTSKDITGIWVAHLNIQGPMFVLQFIIKEDGTYKFRQGNAGGAMPAPGCSGTYTFENGLLSGDLDCSAVGGPASMGQDMDLSQVSLEQLNSEEGFVINYEMGRETYPFKVYKRTKPYFED